MEKDGADLTIASKSPSPKLTTSHISTFASVNKPSAHTLSKVHAISKSPPNASRIYGASAKQSAESQPMTASSSSSSHPAEHINGTAADGNGASPYGTRSRNRTGNPRPNYAEDREPDADFEFTSGKRIQGAAIPSSQIHTALDKVSEPNTRRPSNPSIATQASLPKPTTSTISKDNLPGMSSFSAYPETLAVAQAPAPSRKRKAPGAAPPNNTISTPPQHVVPAPSRRPALNSVSASMKTSNLMTFEGCKGFLKNGKLKADDGTILGVDDQVYLICEPPGEPYYLARIMEFLHVENDRSQPVDSLRINWYFRPRDIQRKVNDTRVVFASMQSDTCPITSLRGKCRVSHRSDIDNMDEYRKAKDSFWYEKMFDRYIHRYYEVIPTRQVINVPAKVKKVLDERWKYVIVEIGRGKDLTSAIKSCKRCKKYCANNESVDCAVCKHTYHMNCVRPPLTKKPARGFGWSCGSCSRKQERRLEARNTTQGDKIIEGEEEEVVEEEDDDHGAVLEQSNVNNLDDPQSAGPRPPTAEQLAQARLWPYRYLGIHCEVEDALDYDDRIYPRASSRLGNKHQATVQPWYGRRVELVKPTDVKKKYMKGSGHKKDAKLTKETVAALEADKAKKEKRPKWVIDEPLGYISRGQDLDNSDLKNTAQLNFRMPQVGESSSRGGDSSAARLDLDKRERLVDEYMVKAKALALPLFNLRDFSTNFLDKALELFTANKYDVDKALADLRKQKRRHDMKEPELTEEEIRRFEDGVAKYGSELRNVSRHVGKSQKHGEIVRFYYMWKKTERGRRIWDNYEGRKGKKQAKQADARLLDDVADDEDDSAFDSAKAAQRKRGFECKFCTSRRSPQWRRAPATAPGTTVPAEASSKVSKDKSNHLMLALCQRCAGLWRKYGIQWENIDEVAKKVAQGGGRAWKRRIDEEMLIELVGANQASSIGLSTTAAAAAASVGLEVTANPTEQYLQDLPKKKIKTTNLDAFPVGPQCDATEDFAKKKVVEKPPEPPPVPETPQLRLFPCDVCYSGAKDDPSLVTCRHCRLTVHPNCYGITSDRADKWMCDTCANDVNPQKSTHYECLFCSQFENEEKSVMELPKQSHKKKSDREKEKDRLEREMIAEATNLYYRQQEEKGRPTEPRQSLKPTTGMNWSHVICSLMHPSIRYTDAAQLQSAEGFNGGSQLSPRSKEARCKLCKTSRGSVLFCDQCDAPVHATCAQRYGYTLGLVLKSVSKNSPAKQMTIGDVTGTAESKVFCREHSDKKNIIYPLNVPAIVDGVEMNALKAFAITNKAVPQGSLTGTARKAELVQAATRQAVVAQAGGASSRNKMTASEPAGLTTRSSRVSPSIVTVQSEEIEDGDRVVHLGTEQVSELDEARKKCAKCFIEASPMWHKSDGAVTTVLPTSEDHRQPKQNLTSRSEAGGEHEVSSIEVRENALGRATPVANVPIDLTQDSPDEKGTIALAGEINGLRPTIEESNHQSERDAPIEHSVWLCHKCFIRRKRTPPTPPREPTPEPVPVQEEIVQQPQEASSESPVEWQPPGAGPSAFPPAPTPLLAPPVQPPVPISLQASAPVPAPALLSHSQVHSHPPAPEPYSGWSAPADSQQPQHHASERLTNGVPYSSPAPIPRPAPHYGPATYPPPPPHHHPAQYAPHPPQYREERASSYRASQAPPYSTHQPTGYPSPAAEPPSFQYRRDPQTGALQQVPYVPPTLRQQGQHAATTSSVRSPTPRAGRSPSVHLRSPSTHEQGPHGPPEADSNPFAILHGSSSHASPPPPPHYQSSIYDSPRLRHERPETPTASYDRESRWPSEIPMPNGASASPSVRNLLH